MEYTAVATNIDLWKMKRLLKTLQSARGNGTSMVSLIIPRGDQIAQTSHMLTNELGAATNIKSRVTRQSVTSALISIQQRLKLYNKVPVNGLAIFCGKIETDSGERQILIDLEPFKPIDKFFYRYRLLEQDSRFGFIIMDGHGCLFGTLSGDTRDVIHKLSVDLPPKHGRGGQSALRFSRLREEKRHNYVRKVAELSTQFFITENAVNCAGIILAGSADFKTELGQSNLFDPRLHAKVIKVVDVSYGGENGFNQAIELSCDVLANVKFVQERKVVQEFFDQVAQDSGKYCFGVDDTMKSLELGAVETLIVWEGLALVRYVTKVAPGGDEVVVYATKEAFLKQRDRVAQGMGLQGNELELVDQSELVEWFSERYKDYGTNLEIVTNKSQEGSQFVGGFGGLGGVLRYKVDFTNHEDKEEEEEFYFSDSE
ncbi:UNVERIFIED_CONTAM: Polypeptide release factor (eRF1) in translation termination [Siphonaria sp. JEL0065]|nr:Polypeptide release factor (eRF1) in translation termination [Siphonaria sp. JEL0065]